MASEIRFKVYLLKIDKIYTLNLPITDRNLRYLQRFIKIISSTGIKNFSHKKLIFAIDIYVVLWPGFLDIWFSFWCTHVQSSGTSKFWPFHPLKNIFDIFSRFFYFSELYFSSNQKIFNWFGNKQMTKFRMQQKLSFYHVWISRNSFRRLRQISPS
jgi:hypothetical protein